MPLPKVTVVGAGQVGATTAHLLALKQLADVTLIDVVEGLAQGKALDMTQSAPVEGFAGKVTGTTDWAALKDSRIVVVTAGLARKPGMSREDLLAANAHIVGPIAEKIAAGSPQAVILIVTNPLDIMVGLALQRSKFPKQRVIGMAGILDSARLRAFIAERLQVAPTAVEAMILGSHGDMMVALRSSITVNGKPLAELLPAAEITQLIDRAKNGGAEIVSLLKAGSAFYAPASSAVQMVQAILRNEQKVLPVCAWLEGEYGLRDVCIGVPAQLGSKGIEKVVETKLSDDERAALHKAAEQVKAGIKSLATLLPAGARA